MKTIARNCKNFFLRKYKKKIFLSYFNMIFIQLYPRKYHLDDALKHTKDRGEAELHTRKKN